MNTSNSLDLNETQSFQRYVMVADARQNQLFNEFKLNQSTETMSELPDLVAQTKDFSSCSMTIISQLCNLHPEQVQNFFNRLRD